jgi:hypothetical protein
MMKKLFIAFIVGAFSFGLFAQDSGLGLGVVFGEPTGISAKMWTSEKTALDAAVAYHIGNPGWLHLHADFLIHNYDLIDVNQGALPVYFGVGGFVSFSSDLGLGARIPFGLDYQFEGAPVDIFAEVVPGLSLIPGIAFYIGGGIGVRYFF